MQSSPLRVYVSRRCTDTFTRVDLLVCGESHCRVRGELRTHTWVFLVRTFVYFTCLYCPPFVGRTIQRNAVPQARICFYRVYRTEQPLYARSGSRASRNINICIGKRFTKLMIMQKYANRDRRSARSPYTRT